MHLMNLEYKPHPSGDLNLLTSTSSFGTRNSPDPVAPQGLLSQLDNEAESPSFSLVYCSQTKEHISCHTMQNTSASAGVQSSNFSSLISSAKAQKETTLLNDEGENVQNISENLVDYSESQCVHSDNFLDSNLIEGRKHTQQIFAQQQPQNAQQLTYYNELQNQIPTQTHCGNSHPSLMQPHVFHNQHQQNKSQAIQVQLQSPLNVQSFQAHQSSPPTRQQSQAPLMQSSLTCDHQQDKESKVRKMTPHVLYQHPQSMPQCQKQNTPVNQQSTSSVHQNLQLIACHDKANIQQRLLFRNPTGDMKEEHQLLVPQNDINNFQQQQLGPQHNMYGLLHHSADILHQAKVLEEQKKTQQALSLSFSTERQQSQSELQQQQLMSQLTQQTPLQQHLGYPNKSNLLQTDMFQMRASTSLLQTQNAIEHQKQLFRFQGRPSEASARWQTNAIDGHEVVHQKIKSMKEMYMPLLMGIYKKIKILQTTDSGQIDRYQKCRLWLEGILRMFDRFPDNIPPDLTEEKLLPIERQIFDFIKMNRTKRHIFSQQQVQKQFQPTGAQSSRCQMPQLQYYDNQINSVMQNWDLKNYALTMQPNAFEEQFRRQHLRHPFIHQQQMTKQQHQQTILQQNPHQQMLRQSRQLAYNHQSPLVAGALSYTSSPRPLQVATPHATQHSSPQIDQQSLLSLPQSKSGASPQLEISPTFPLSLSTSLSMPTQQLDNLKTTSNSLHFNGGNGVEKQTVNSETQPQALVIDTPGMSLSPLLAEDANSDKNEGPTPTVVSDDRSETQKPIERLIKVVESMSCKALSASVSDIKRAVSMIDTIVGSVPGNQHEAAVGEDLVATAKHHLLAKNLFYGEEIVITKNMNYQSSGRPRSVVTLEGSSVSHSYKPYTGKETSDVESTATSRIKRPRVEVNQALLKEIKDINQQMVNTVVDISEEDNSLASLSDVTQGTIVKCSFTSFTTSQQQIFPVLQIYFLVSSNYPNCSPGLLDKLPLEPSKKTDDLLLKARFLFSQSLRCLSQPMSLKEMVKSWDACARGVILEYAVQNGGGSFSTRYGAWQTL